MTQKFSRAWAIAVLTVMLPVFGSCAAIQVNAVCQVGNCNSPDSIGVGQSSTGSYNFNLTLADGDQYSVVGSYSNSYAPQNLGFFPVVTYTGNYGNIFTPAVQTDVLSFVMFQNFYDDTGTSWDGQYCESIPFTLPALAKANGNTYFDGNGIGFLAAGTGSSSQSSCANLSFTAAENASATMMTQTLLDFQFLGGNLAPTSASSGAGAPEVGARGLVGVGVLVLGAMVGMKWTLRLIQTEGGRFTVR